MQEPNKRLHRGPRRGPRIAGIKEKGARSFDLTPCFTGAPGRIRTHDPLVRRKDSPVTPRYRLILIDCFS